MSMSPQVLARLEALATPLARVWSRRRMDSLVQANGRRVFETFSANTALARICVAVLVQIVLLQVNLCTIGKKHAAR